ncbi:hypothetical protein QBC40DRAFT_316010 [Triangularia verruculosa]|uniref:Tyrosinase copper-binding domain-containing protein n=1 Tax=Triangularia verruculosa TaxID=2587418 RepID=A0AAN6X7N2_9PEZI|nr:hypothetical protein QBC40DRAFT_316010 [Triangularia verruculosa]
MTVQPPSYTQFVQFQRLAKPCLSGLVDFLTQDHGIAGKIIALDLPSSEQSVAAPRLIAEADLADFVNNTSAIHGRFLFVEDIRPQVINFLGEILNLDPVFFANHAVTDFGDVEKPAPPALGLFPSQVAQLGHMHLHYQQVLDLGRVEAFRDLQYKLKTESNVARSVRLLPPLLARQLALARGCCSVAVKSIRDTWICLVLVDPPVKRLVVEIGGAYSRMVHPCKPLNGGFEDFIPSATFASFRDRNSTREDYTWDRQSMLGTLLHYFANHPPPGFTATRPSTLSLCYYPTRIVLAEWILYTQLMSHYFKYHECKLQDIENRLHANNIVDLQRWRRRSIQSQHKLRLLAEFIEYWLPHEPSDKQPWNLVLKDIQHLLSQLQQYNRALKHVVPMATSMVQLLESRRSMQEAANVGRLTLIATVFVPLSWVAGLFGMSEEYTPGHERFWVYWAAALPLLVLVLLLPALQRGLLAERLKEAMAVGSWRRVDVRSGSNRQELP